MFIENFIFLWQLYLTKLIIDQNKFSDHEQAILSRDLVVKFIKELKHEGETFYLTEQGTYKNNVINFLSGSAIVMDTFICMTNTNFSARTNLLIITFIIYIYSYIRPLYNMTHLGLHILLGFQTLALCQSNIVANINM